MRSKCGDCQQLEDEIYEELFRTAGVIMSRESLSKALGYPSVNALNKAVQRGQSPVPVFKLEKRSHWHARTREVAEYLARRRLSINSDMLGGDCMNSG